jgi:hypothetical protein
MRLVDSSLVHAGGTPVAISYNDSQCQNYVSSAPIGQSCSPSTENGLPVYTETVCLNEPDIYYSRIYAGLGCSGAVTQTLGYAAGSCVPYSATQSALYDCTEQTATIYNSQDCNPTTEASTTSMKLGQCSSLGSGASSENFCTNATSSFPVTGPNVIEV